MSVIDRPDPLAATAVENAIVAVSLELSRSKWLVTSLLPGSEKMSKHMVAAGDAAALLSLLERRRRQAEERVGGPVRVVAIEEAHNVMEFLDGSEPRRMHETTGRVVFRDAGKTHNLQNVGESRYRSRLIELKCLGEEAVAEEGHGDG